ncbi:hypothetical protein BDV28DRAFT_144440 [Aspergillus coremiiformis]|uniref:Uncharacterized protein n=1 Tax=Aspergillus coremiiformis TaxID=138285 RepID=A0A5N6YR96_9EURO|nr:hypothetical protein BDV28DRAFT_144440 [Aspergillus coremiiformis]
MAGLLAVVANPFTFGFSRAVPGNMSDLSTVVTLLTVGAVPSHVTEATTGIAGLLAATEPTSIAATLRTISCNVADPAALITFLATGSTTIGITRGCLRTFAGDMANTTATVTGLFLRSYCAFTANMSLCTTVVASRGALLGTITGL